MGVKEPNLLRTWYPFDKPINSKQIFQKASTSRGTTVPLEYTNVGMARGVAMGGAYAGVVQIWGSMGPSVSSTL